MVNWKEVVYYDETSPSCLRWACDIYYKGLYEGSAPTVLKHKGEVAGSLQRSNGRYKLKYDQKAYMAHRIVYELFNGVVGDLKIDHIDGDATNNSIANLRPVTQSVNARNVGKSRANKTGVTGVSRLVVDDKYGHYEYYSANWHEGGKMKTKRFSIGKLGEDEAFRLACEHRDKMISALNEQGAGYTGRHGK